MQRSTLFPFLALVAAAACSAPLGAHAAPAPFAAPAPVVDGGAAELADQVDQLIAEGRALLALKRATEAEGLFLQAAELDGNTLRTRMWVLRAWMDQGNRNNETLDTLDVIARTHDGPDVDYLYGMTFARRAEEQIAQGLVQSVDMNFSTAIELLSQVVEVDPERYADAFLPLARSAWYQSKLDVARPAAEEALRRFPKDPEAAFELGRIALSQYSAAKTALEPDVAEDAAAAVAVDRHWEAARDAFRLAVKLSGAPNKQDARGISLLAQANLQLGHTLMWKDLRAEAKPAYAAALAWSPETVDCGQLFNMLGGEDLRAVLEEAAPAFATRYGDRDPRDATLLWWLGYTRFHAQQDAAAEEAFVATLKKAPYFANAWFYVAMARYNQKDYDGSTAALLEGWNADPPAILGEMSRDVTLNSAKLEYMIGPCVEAGRFADAAVLAEICAESAQTEPRHWNNLGFFLREDAIRLATSDDDADKKRAMRVFEASLTAYERSLELAPDDPVYLNDTAVILHYYLDRELERALGMYDDAAEKATAKLDAGGLAPEEKDLVRTALRDATNNGRALRKLMDQRAAAAAKKAAEAAEAARKAGAGGDDPSGGGETGGGETGGDETGGDETGGDETGGDGR